MNFSPQCACPSSMNNFHASATFHNGPINILFLSGQWLQQLFDLEHQASGTRFFFSGLPLRPTKTSETVFRGVALKKTVNVNLLSAQIFYTIHVMSGAPCFSGHQYRLLYLSFEIWNGTLPACPFSNQWPGENRCVRRNIIWNKIGLECVHFPDGLFCREAILSISLHQFF